MTLEQLLQSLLMLTPEQRKQELKIFNYGTNRFIASYVEVCVEGEPEWHLTVDDKEFNREI